MSSQGSGALFALVDRAFGWVSSTLNAMGTALILLVMIAVNADILGRVLFSQPVVGVTEIVIVSIAAIVFLQFSHTLRTGRVIQADSFLVWLRARRPRTVLFLQACYEVVGAAAFVVIFYYTLPFFERALESGDAYGNPAIFSIPKWPVRLIALIGSAAMVVQFLLLALRNFALALRSGDREAAS